MLSERVNSIPYLFYSEHSQIALLHFFLKRLNFTPEGFYRFPVEDRNRLFELEQEVIKKENEDQNSNPDFQ